MLKNAAKKVDIFKGLERDQFDELLGWFEKRKYAKNENIFEEGQEAVGLYLLCHGSVGVVKRTDGGRFRLADVESPSIFGEMGLLSQEPRSATVRAKSDVVVGQLFRQVFRDKLRQDNLTAYQVLFNIACLLTARLNSADQEIARLKAKVSRLQKKKPAKKTKADKKIKAAAPKKKKKSKA